MAQPDPTHSPQPQSVPPGPDNPLQPAIIIYVLYLVGLILPITALGGLIYAYVERGKDPMLDTHLSFQIRTFWWGLLMLVIGTITSLIVIGLLLLLYWTVWLIVRMITGIQLAQRRRPVSGVGTMGFKAIYTHKNAQ